MNKIEVKKSLIEIISNAKDKNYIDISDNRKLVDELDFDSMDLIDLLALISLELEVNLKPDEVNNSTTFGDLVKSVCKKLDVPYDEPKKIKYWCYHFCTYDEGNSEKVVNLGFIYETDDEFSSSDIGKTKELAINILNQRLGIKSENIKSVVLVCFNKLRN